MNVWVPENAKPGTYTGTLTVRGGGMDDRVLKLNVQVLNRTLPSPSDWHLNLDLWQNPYAVAG